MKHRRVFIVALCFIIAACLLVGYVFVMAVTAISGTAGFMQACGSDSTLQAEAGDIGNSGSAELGKSAVDYLKSFSEAQRSEQISNARTIMEVGVRLAKTRAQTLTPSELAASGGVITKHDIEAAVGVAIQESNLLNIPYGDRDSIGLFQQRPSMGWGTAQQIIDPVYAAGQFYTHLLADASQASRMSMSLIDIGIKVQRPNPAAYHSRWEWDGVARDLVDFYLKSSPVVDNDESGTCGQLAGLISGEWILPLKPRSYCVTSPFGQRDINFHEGIDLSCNAGNPVYAVHEGTIITARTDDSGWGTHVVVDHGGGIDTGYAHLLRIQPGITPGVHVQAGQVIGYVGDTGHSFGAHLHFEVLVNGKYVDPEPFMRDHGAPIR